MLLGELRRPPPLPRSAHTDFARDGFCVVPGWLSPTAIHAIRQDALLCEEAGLPRRAGIGSTRHGETAVRLDDSARRASMLPLYPPPRLGIGLPDVRIALGEAVRSLAAELQAGQPSLPTLAPFRTEMAYLYYPVGGYYKRHIDVPAARDGWTILGRSPEDGGSFSGSALRREVSMLVYLDPCWDRSWGGALRVFLRDKRSHFAHEQVVVDDTDQGSPEITSVHADTAEESYIDVTPEAGTLVLMRSDMVPHEVLETCRPRHCIVGWLRQER